MPVLANLVKPKISLATCWRTLLVAGIFAILAWGGITLTRDGGRIAALWLPNAVLVALLLRNDARNGGAYVWACFLANVAASYLALDPLVRAVELSCVNTIEIALTVIVLRRICGPAPDMARLPDLGAMLTISIITPAISAAFAAHILADPGSLFDVSAWRSWAIADGLGLMIIAPVTMIAIDAWRRRHSLSASEAAEWLSFAAGATLWTMLIFSQSRFPFLFLASPLVIIAAFRTGVTGTAAAIVIVSIIASIATMFGTGPIMLVKGDFADKLITLQTFLACSFAMGLPVAAVLAERAAVRRDLTRSRDFAQSMLENMREVMFKTEEPSTWSFLNPAWQLLTGYSVEESIGKPISSLVHPDDIEGARAIYGGLRSGSITDCAFKLRILKATAECLHVEISIRRLTDADGRFTGTIGTIRDVSRSVAAERAARASEQRFQSLANLSPVGICRTDAAGNCNYVNPAWLRVSGLPSLAAAADEGWASAVHPDDRERVMAEWHAAVDAHSDYQSEFRFLRPDGEVSWIVALGRPELGDDGNFPGYIAVMIDVTESKSAAAELATRDEQLRMLADNATDAVFRLDLTGRCIYASPSAQSLLVIEPAQMIGHSLLERFHRDDAAQVRSAFQSLADGTREQIVVAYRSELPRSRGSFIWLEAHCGLVRNAVSGAPQEIIASVRNISDRKALEAELIDARTTAENAAAAKSVFLANMSHEIRTPMNGVMGFAELLLGSDLDDDQHSHAQLIADSGRAMMRLLNDILDMSKIEAGQMTVASEPVDLRHKIANCIKLMEPIARQKGLAIELTIDPALPQFILGDASRLRQIVLNLVGNAVKFTDRGSITVNVAPVQSYPALLQIAVADTGIGIAEDRRVLIFQQFAQADGSIARKYGGSGLGLTISSQLAGLMGGSLDVDSEVGVGTTFRLLVPLEAAEAPPERVRPCVEATGARSARTLDSPRVLIAEDHDINQSLILAMAKRAGIRADLAENGEQAIAKVEAAATSGDPYLLILMDVQMPVVDGIEATRRLRAAGHLPAVLPIVALTANAYSDDISACLAAGMQAHLAKPVRLRDLASIIDTWVKVPSTHALAMSNAPRSPGASLTDQYLARKAGALEAVALLVRQGDYADKAVEDVASLLHKLAGTAGFFGDGTLGEVAGALERSLMRAPVEDRAELLVAGNAALRAAA